MKRTDAAQSLIEYAVIFMVVALAVTAIHRYMYRSMNARLKQVQEQVSYKAR